MATKPPLTGGSSEFLGPTPAGTVKQTISGGKQTISGGKQTATAKAPAKGKAKAPAKKANPNANPKIKYPGDVTYDPVTGEQIVVDPIEDTDTTFHYDPVTGEQVSADELAQRQMEAADYEMVDPSKISGQYGDIAREQMQKNADLSSKLALEALDTELKGLQSYAPAAAALKRGEIAKDNQFNQAQREAQLAQGDPNLRKDLEAQAQRARDYAAGRVPDSISDRALELGVRSKAADLASGGGFGARSSAARKASELMSAEQRIGLSQYGDQLLTSNITNRNQLLLAPTEYSDAGSQIKVTPTQSAAQIAMGLTTQANDKTIISSTDALQNLTQQQQFKTGIQQEANKFNTSLAAERDIQQAQLNLQAATTNVQTNLSAQEINARNAIQTQTTAMNIKSQENQFRSQMQFNVKNANANRTFEAANVNAGRALDAATSNRAARIDVDKFNKNIIFQDQQARKADAAAMARTRVSEAGANARAAMSASVQRESIAANIQMQREGFQFQLQQQAMATETYKQGLKDTRHAQDMNTAGQAISRIPEIYGGISKAAQAASDIYKYFSDTPTTVQGVEIEKGNFDIGDFKYNSGGGEAQTSSGDFQYGSVDSPTYNLNV